MRNRARYGRPECAFGPTGWWGGPRAGGPLGGVARWAALVGWGLFGVFGRALVLQGEVGGDGEDHAEQQAADYAQRVVSLSAAGERGRRVCAGANPMARATTKTISATTAKMAAMMTRFLVKSGAGVVLVVNAPPFPVNLPLTGRAACPKEVAHHIFTEMFRLGPQDAAAIPLGDVVHEGA